MKHVHIFNTFCLFVGITLFVSSCQVSVSKPADITDEVYTIPHDSLYVICKDLSGLNDFKIGMTLKQVRATKLYRSQKFYSISSDFVSFYGGKWRYSNYDEADWITKNCKGEIKQMVPHVLGNFKIGDLEFRDMNLAFLHDTLVAIHFYPENKETYILNHYKEKYGNGNGSYYHYRLDNEPCEDRDLLRVDEKETEKHKWENERVALEYYNTSSFYLAPNEKIRSYNNHYYLVYDKKRYPVFEDLWKGWDKKYQEHVKNSHESSVNSL